MVAAVLALTLGATLSRAWFLTRGWLPTGHALRCLLGLALVCAACAFLRSKWRPAMAAAAAAAMYASASVAPLGDQTQWLKHMQSRELFVSEPLGQLLYKLARSTGVVEYVPVVAGMMAAFLFLTIGQSLAGRTRQAWLAVAGTYLATSTHLVFFRGFVEHPPLALPLVLLFVWCGCRYVAKPERSRLVATTAIITVAALVHGSALFLLPAWWITIGVADSDSRQRWQRLGVALGTHILVVGACVLIVLAVGYRLSPGNAAGGGDGQMFVPLWSATGFARFTFFSWAHLVQIANICAAGSPVFLAIGVASIGRPQETSGSSIFIALLACAYLGFITVWNFDLGFPGDFDLMVSFAPLLGLWTCSVLRSVSGWWRPLGLLGSIAIAWSLIQRFLRVA